MGAFAGAAQVISDRQHQQHLLDYQQNYLQNQALASEFGRLAEDPRTLPQFRPMFRQQQIDAIMEAPGKLHKPKVPLADLVKQQEQARIQLNQTDPHSLPGGMVDHLALSQGIPPPPTQTAGPASDTSSGAAFSTPNQSGTPYQGESYGAPPPLAPGQAPQPQGPPGANGMMNTTGFNGGQFQVPAPTPEEIAQFQTQRANGMIGAQQASASAPSQVSGMPSPGNGNPLSPGSAIAPPPQVQAPVQPVSSVPNFGMRPAHMVAAEAVGPEPQWTAPGTWEESPEHSMWRSMFSTAFTNEEQRQAALRSQMDLFAYKRAENKKFIDEYTGGGGQIKWKIDANGDVSAQPDTGVSTPGYTAGAHILQIDPDAQATAGKTKSPIKSDQLYRERHFENGNSEYRPVDIRARFQYELDPVTHQPITVGYDPVTGHEVTRLPGHPLLPGLLPVTSLSTEFKEVTDPVTGLPHLLMIPNVPRTTTKGGIAAPTGAPAPSLTAPPGVAPAGNQSIAPPPGSPAATGVPSGGSTAGAPIANLPRGARDLGVSPGMAKLTKTTALKSYAPALDAAERFNVMSQNYVDAVKNHDQQAMLSLLANHLGMTMGMARGSRITQTLYNEAEKSRPWLQGALTKFDSDGYLTGVTLSQPQMYQMLSLGRERFAQDLAKAKSEAGYMGAVGEGPPRTLNKAGMHYYMGLAQGDVGKAKSLAATDGWTVK